MILFNYQEIEKDYFSNSEVRIADFKKRVQPYSNRIDLKYETENPEYKVNDDLMILYFIKQELYKNCGNVAVDLYLRTMPYQRMDHKSGNYLHTLPYVAKFINDLGFTNIYVVEPHSEMTKKYLGGNAEMIFPMADMLKEVKSRVLIEVKEHIVFPDAGAYERYGKALKEEGLVTEEDICVFSKKRDHDTNKIVQHELSQGNITKGSRCFILDDICSSGKTLLDVAYYAKMAGAKYIYIVVVHCENTALSSDLLKEDSPVDEMFTTTSMISCYHPKITYI